MKTKFKCGIVAVAVMAAGFVAYQTYGSYGAQDNSLLMQNIEALAQSADAEGDANDDANGDADSVVKCKKRYYAPNAMISTSKLFKSFVKCYKKGSVFVKETENSTDSFEIKGKYKKNQEYEVTFYFLNCKEHIGACCDLRRVGAHEVK